MLDIIASILGAYKSSKLEQIEPIMLLGKMGIVFSARARQLTSSDSFYTQDEIENFELDKLENQIIQCFYNREKLYPRQTINEYEYIEENKYGWRYWLHDKFVKKYILNNKIRKFDVLRNILISQLDEQPKLQYVMDVSAGNSKLLIEAAAASSKDVTIVCNDLCWERMSSSFSSREDNRVVFTNHDATVLPFKKKLFGLALCINSLHHMHSLHHQKVLMQRMQSVSDRVVVVEVEDPQHGSAFPKYLNKYWYRGFLGEVAENYLSGDEFRKVVLGSLNNDFEVEFQKINSLMATFSVAILKRVK